MHRYSDACDRAPCFSGSSIMSTPSVMRPGLLSASRAYACMGVLSDRSRHPDKDACAIELPALAGLSTMRRTCVQTLLGWQSVFHVASLGLADLSTQLLYITSPSHAFLSDFFRFFSLMPPTCITEGFLVSISYLRYPMYRRTSFTISFYYLQNHPSRE